MSLKRPLLALALLVGLAGCGGPIDPDRPPLYDYEFDPIDDGLVEPSRV